jgi:PAS domain S-box-containing protein
MRLNIFSKFMIVVVSVAVLVGGLGVMASIQEQKEVLETLYYQKAEVLARTLDAAVTERDLSDHNSLQASIYKLQLLDPDVQHIEVFKEVNGELAAVISVGADGHETGHGDFNEKAFQNNKSEFYLDSHDAKTYLHLYTPLHVSGRVAGTYNIVLSLTQLQSATQRQLSILLALILLTVAIYVISASVLIRKVVITPLNELIKVANQLESGNFDVQIKKISDDEIGLLAKAFSDMAKKLKYSYGELEKRVQEKTAELEQALATSRNQNAELEKNKVAMLNILEDEKHLNEELSKFELALNSTSDHVIITDVDGKILYANKAVEIITGYSHDEVIGNNPRLWGKQMEPEFYKKFWKTIKEDLKPFTGEVTNQRKGGTTYYAYATVSPILDKEQQLLGFVGVERDISDVKKYQENLEALVEERTSELKKAHQKISESWLQLREEKAKLVGSIEAISRAYVLLDPQGEVLIANQELTKILGPVEDGWTLTKIEQKLHDIFDIKKAFDDCLKSSEPLYIKELSVNAKFIDLYIAPVFLDKKDIVGVLILMQDISEQKIIERSRDEFFSIASHELRTPLTAIRGNVSMINDMFADEIKNPEVKDMLKDIHESSLRLIGIVNDFLNTSRLEMGKMEFKKEELDISDLITDILKEYKAASVAGKVKIKFTKPKTKLPLVLADKDKVREVLVNLIGNSLKFTEKGSITITPTVEKEFVEVTVTDTGRGISAENQALLFRKFQQAGDSLYTRDTTKGTGLGLYISKLIIEGMGGSIRLVSSEVDKGTTMAVTLPVAVAPH